MNKKNFVIISGGSSNEFKISLRSGYDISEELYKWYNVFNIVITPTKKWLYSNNYEKIFINPNNITNIDIDYNSDEVFQIGNGMINNLKIDCAILTTHGVNGEDGKLQGLLDLYDIPYIGSGVLGSAIGMDKETSKILVKNININVLPWITLYPKSTIDLNYVKSFLGNNLIVKTTNGGSSIGVFKADLENLELVVTKAFKMNSKIIIEPEIKMRELEIGFIGDDFSVVGEIMKKDNDFYDYQKKYVEEIIVKVPAKINKKLEDDIIKKAKAIKKVLNLDNFCRIDFFLINQELYFNEVNTLPGFQKSSMFPKLWYDKGLSYKEILDKIINNKLIQK